MKVVLAINGRKIINIEWILHVERLHIPRAMHEAIDI